MNLISKKFEFYKYKDFVKNEFEKDKDIKQIPYTNEKKDQWEDNIKKRFVSRIIYNIENGENSDLDSFVQYLKDNCVYIESLGFNMPDSNSIKWSFDRKILYEKEIELERLKIRKKISKEC